MRANDDDFVEQIAEKLLRLALSCPVGEVRDGILVLANECLDHLDPEASPEPRAN